MPNAPHAVMAIKYTMATAVKIAAMFATWETPTLVSIVQQASSSKLNSMGPCPASHVLPPPTGSIARSAPQKTPAPPASPTMC